MDVNETFTTSNISVTLNMNLTTAVYDSNVTLTSSDDVVEDAYDTNYATVRYVQFCMLAFILPIGFCCNVLSIVVLFYSRQIRRTTTGHYLIALAFADCFVMLTQFLNWLNSTLPWSFSSIKGGPSIDIRFVHDSNAACKGLYAARYFSEMLSSWITVIITAERFITVTYPLKVSTISTPKIAKICIAALIFVCIGLNWFPIYTLGLKALRWDPNLMLCQIINKDYSLWLWVSTRTLTLLVPSALVLIFTILIIVHLFRAKRIRENQLDTNIVSKKMSQESQITSILLTIAIAFLVLRVPYIICYYVQYEKDNIWPDLDYWTRFHIYGADAITRVLSSLNYAINFFLYCMCGTAFRNALKKCCGMEQKRRGSTTISTSLATSRASNLNNLDGNISQASTPRLNGSRGKMSINGQNGQSSYL